MGAFTKTREEQAKSLREQADAIRTATRIPIDPTTFSTEQQEAIRVYRQHLLGFARGLDSAADILEDE